MATPSARELVMGVMEDGAVIPKEIMVAVAVTTTQVRNYLRDIPHYNEITRQELSEGELADCIIDAIAEFNAMPPFFGHENPISFPNRVLLRDWAIVFAIKRLYTWHARNQFSAEDSGVQVPVHEQWQPLKLIADQMDMDVKERSNRLKAQLNIRNGWGGGVGSPIGWGW